MFSVLLLNILKKRSKWNRQWVYCPNSYLLERQKFIERTFYWPRMFFGLEEFGCISVHKGPIDLRLWAVKSGQKCSSHPSKSVRNSKNFIRGKLSALIARLSAKEYFQDSEVYPFRSQFQIIILEFLYEKKKLSHRNTLLIEPKNL